MIAAGFASLFLQSRAAGGIVELMRRIDPALPAGPLNQNDPHGFAWLMVLTTAFTTLTWITVTLLTPPEPDAKLREFYQRVRPARLGWRRFAADDPQGKQNLLWATADWIAGCTLIYCSLFGIGHLILGSAWLGIALLAVAGLCAWFIFWDLNRRGWETLTS